MIQAAKIIGTDLATTGLIGAGVGMSKVLTLLHDFYLALSKKSPLLSPSMPHPFVTVQLQSGPGDVFDIVTDVINNISMKNPFKRA
jgi:hypothetical protein